jgi:hypothetical protein
MRFIVYLLLVLFIPSYGAVEKDLNLSALKKAYSWLVNVSEETPSVEPKTVSDLNNIDNLWDSYKDLMKRSIVLIRKYPKKIFEKLPTLLDQSNQDIFPLIAFYLYSIERQDKTLRYYDAFNVTVTPMNHDNLWIAAIPFKDSENSTYSNYSILIIDFNNRRILTKD